MIKRMVVMVSLAGSLTLGVALPMTPASATPNGSGLAQCERNAAERLARKLQGGGANPRARRQFNNDIARCKRRFG